MANGGVRATGLGSAMPSRVSTGGPGLPSDNHISQNALLLITWRLRNTEFYSDLARIILRATRGTVLDKIAEDISVYPIMFLPPPRLSECFLGELPERLFYEFTKCLMHGSVPAPIVSRNAEDAPGCVAQSSHSPRQTPALSITAPRLQESRFAAHSAA